MAFGPTTQLPTVTGEGDYEMDMESESDSDAETMRCISCQEDYDAHDGGTCKECYDEANDTEEDLKREIEDLRAKVAFLKLCDSMDYPNHYSTAPTPYSTRFSDVILVALEGTSGAPAPAVPAHKAVLASRSPVFRAMLENEMEESRSGTIKINDVSYEALRAFVNYLYTADADFNEHMAYSLLVLAEKYQVNHLKICCERFLISTLNWDNLIGSYAFAHQHNAKLVLEASLSMITENMDKLTKREEFLELKEKDPHLIVEIYEASLSKQVNTAACKDSSQKS
ncbi:BTB/POZ domain-containing protein At4g08455 isoform X1 [Cannabis sativa]|uniref:BTB/POZ domain-containing protein At4g08455 isoform X1 n=1 Tax=Cannabis sativa TaxID=3483 RepID=UPI0011DF60AE|nr:BTB/POZ domain-containing protein At4g08455 isoform X1 [Cannabis sativa]